MNVDEQRGLYLFKEWIKRRLYDLKIDYSIMHTEEEYIEINAKIKELENVLNLFNKYIEVNTNDKSNLATKEEKN